MTVLFRTHVFDHARARLGFAVLFAALALGVSARSALAQYGTSFYYHNPRTGFTYSQGVGVGSGSAYGGFGYSNGRHSYSAGSGYSGQNYYNGMGYSNRNYSYGQRSWYGPGYYYGGTYYSGRRPAGAFADQQEMPASHASREALTSRIAANRARSVQIEVT